MKLIFLMSVYIEFCTGNWGSPCSWRLYRFVDSHVWLASFQECSGCPAAERWRQVILVTWNFVSGFEKRVAEILSAISTCLKFFNQRQRRPTTPAWHPAPERQQTRWSAEEASSVKSGMIICFYEATMRLYEFGWRSAYKRGFFLGEFDASNPSFIRLSGANDVQLGERRAGERRVGERRAVEGRARDRGGGDRRVRDRGGGDRRAGVVVHVAICGLLEKSYSAYWNARASYEDEVTLFHTCSDPESSPRAAWTTHEQLKSSWQRWSPSKDKTRSAPARSASRQSKIPRRWGAELGKDKRRKLTSLARWPVGFCNRQAEPKQPQFL